MSIKKQYLKSKPVCKVTFRLPKEAADSAKRVQVVGDFNGWGTDGHRMKRLKSGAFTTTIDLDLNREYQFRYLIDGTNWENDWDADRYVPTIYGGSENSVVVV
ncbi:MAG: isoamylase early set domain-containing protein [Thermodesulfobacteriota bacterium]|nr:isoamylase early set domain-containing protein [Thermodesulfobacteriota bacterium]